MILPLVLRSTEEAILDVPRGYREASYALGATRWQTVSRVVLKAAAPRIITGIILGMGRAFGETAAVMLTAGMAINLPVSIFHGGRNMSSHLYLLATEGISIETAFGTAFLLLLIILIFNISAKRIARRI
jgi:phosphate transport system permease protein